MPVSLTPKRSEDGDGDELDDQDNDALHRRFAHITELTILTIQLIVEYSKHIPGFLTLTREDQILLLKVCNGAVGSGDGGDVDVSPRKLKIMLSSGVVESIRKSWSPSVIVLQGSRIIKMIRILAQSW